ncbi:hypothetical protein NM208_g11858 [Fusarium decemcellulare]|uniref:Uncharacterized protein n=1 Tax=Fusarium decemcellulare TaxID=57161 RepID=A0ACC1RSZ6_9HYPO|nr:hypothetical protein NM208_g11858 [Fusarium decemcellulare]
MSAPPSYEDASAPPPSHDDLTAPFANLNIKPLPHYPDPDTCLAHLKLLFAFESLKEDVGYTDGLWGIWDTRANGKLITTEDGEVREHAADEGHDSDVDDKQKFLSQIREKRWALFVARAVDRYEAWWDSLGTPRPLIETDMDEIQTVAYEYFPKIEDPTFWDKKSLPPLDVLMVFHSHLLNPYNFLEDCMRRGHRQLWQSGMPWHLVNAAIDESFNYNIPDDDKRRWLSQTGRSWENADDSLFKSTKCPGCQMPMNIPWTTCSLDEDSKSFQRPGLIGSGYGDGKLDHRCSSCGIRVTKELLSVAKFCRDSRHLLTKGYPMPGTILNPSKGMPEAWVRYPRQQWNYQTFANRMIKLVLRIQIQDLLKDPDLDKPPTMETVRKMIEDEALIKQSALRVIHEGSTDARSTRKRAVPPIGRICIRKMMSRYWENFSPFALDLCGAVMRQGIFSEKMCKMDWLHSPTARETMGRLCTKYERFMKIMASYERKLVVPTLDVDLAWHTHQLSPLAYYDHTTHVTKKFIRHDDKVEDDKLSDGFEFTSKVYQESYNEPYSECTCWYCESVRASHISSVGKMFGLSKNEKSKHILTNTRWLMWSWIVCGPSPT